MYNTYDWKTVHELSPIPELPDPFLKPDGTRVSDPSEWPPQREYLRTMINHYMYGPLPPNSKNTAGVVVETELAYGGRAIYEKLQLSCGVDHGISFHAYIVRPNKPGSFPAIVWNALSVTKNYEQMKAHFNRMGLPMVEADRDGFAVSPMEEETVCNRNYCLVKVDVTEIASDEPNPKGQLYQAYPEYPWKSIAAWAWCQMRVIDYLEGMDYVDKEKIIATGHSRYGKATLCAAINDERIALAAPMGSGCGGTGCFRILGGRDGFGKGRQETLGGITKMFPHWFTEELETFGVDGNSVDRLPFDLHTVKALIAPRCLLSGEGLDDEWANPYGAQITWAAANQVFEFLGVGSRNAIHFREGGHDFHAEDWTALLNFADRMLRGIHGENEEGICNPYYQKVPQYYNWAVPKK